MALDPFSSSELHLKDATFFRLQALIKDLTGVHLAENKKQLVFSRLRMRLRDLKIDDFETYEACLRGPSGHAERQVFIDLLTTHETYFFREPAHFDFLKNVVLPSHDKKTQFRVWSAACSTGEEAYSLAMVLAGTWGLGLDSRWEVHGSDVSERAVQKAAEGVYLNQRMDGIPIPYRRDYLLSVPTDTSPQWAVNPQLKSQVKFRTVNLNADLPPMGQFDVIFLRNMLIYFEPEAKIKIVQRLLKVLKPKGYLFTGHTEYLREVDPALKSVAPAVYRWQDATP